MLINRDFFKQGSRYISNINEPDPNNRNVKDLEHFIELCENDIYLSAFGYEMTQDFKQHLLADGGLDSSAPQNYKDLVNGVKYTKDNKDYYWRGLISDNPKTSLIADLVYYVYKNNNTTQTVDFGESVMDSKIGHKASNTPKMVEAWNSFVNVFCGGFRSNADGFTLEGNPFWFYGERGVDYYGAFDNKIVSLIRFLDDNRSNYPLLDLEVSKISLSYKNSFGL